MFFSPRSWLTFLTTMFELDQYVNFHKYFYASFSFWFFPPLCKQFAYLEFAPSKQFLFSSSGVSEAVEELDKILVFNDLLISLKNHPDVDRIARGVGAVSLIGKLPNCLFLSV